MNIEDIRNYCLLKKETIEDLPFDENTLVFKVQDKIYALTNLEGDLSINLKCDPEKAITLREHYEAILPGYHMNKKHWNTVKLDGSLKPPFIEQLIDHSYDLVVLKLTKNLKNELDKL